MEQTREECERSETAEEKGAREAAERVAQERAAAIEQASRKERAARVQAEEERYRAGHGVKAADGQMRVIFRSKRDGPLSDTDGAAGRESDVETKKRRKKKKKMANTSLLSFGEDDI